jgi:hypothetical protein
MRYSILEIHDTKGHLFTHLYGAYVSRKEPDMMDIARRYVPDAKSVKHTEVTEGVVLAFGRLGRVELPPDCVPKPKKTKKEA